MREIKFRAHYKPLGTIYGVTEIMWSDQTVCLINSADDCRVESLDDVDLLQFTGLKDKNGKKIWEGDIVRLHPALNEDIRREQGKRYQVEYIAPSWMLSYEDGSFSRGGYGWWENQVEVIGNIYEN